MSDNKRKRLSSSTTLSTSYDSKGFETHDQRLPPSPQSSDVRPSDSTSNGFMAMVRAGCRNALDVLFGTKQRVLNAPCYASMSPTLRSSKRPLKRRRRSTNLIDTHTPHDDENISTSSSQQQQSQSIQHHTDQVVPAVENQNISFENVEIDSFAQCPSPEQCACAKDLWKQDGIGPELMLRTAEELRTKMNNLYSHAIDPATSQVDYSSLVHSIDFHQYLASARKLRYFNPLSLDEQDRKAFFLNVYNCLMIHAITVMPKPRSMFERISMYNTASYDIGGRCYSLNMIEHGVLRSNRKGGGPIAEIPFRNNDARKQCSLTKVDPRIHFALNCGAKSCPAVRFYETKTLDKTLDLATRCYLEDLEVDYEERIVTLPKILQWYRVDFCDDDNVDTVIKWTLPYLNQRKRKKLQNLLKEQEEDTNQFKVVYADYDWTVNDISIT